MDLLGISIFLPFRFWRNRVDCLDNHGGCPEASWEGESTPLILKSPTMIHICTCLFWRSCLVTMACNTGNVDMDIGTLAANYVYIALNATAHWDFDLICSGWLNVFPSSFAIPREKKIIHVLVFGTKLPTSRSLSTAQCVWNVCFNTLLPKYYTQYIFECV